MAVKRASVPIIHYDEDAAREAYLAHVGMITHEFLDPTLKENSAWARLRAIAFEQFENAFEGQS